MAKKIVGVILNILIAIAVLAIVLIVYSMVQTKILKRDYVNLFGYTAFQVVTGSMSPTMEVKDIIIAKVIKEEQVKDLKIDDIIVFKQEKAMITHRIVEITEENITAKGDANNAKDDPIEKDEIIGKVVKIIPNISIWEKVIAEPKVYISIIVTITLWGITLLYKPEEKIKTDGEKANEKTKDEEK